MRLCILREDRPPLFLQTVNMDDGNDHSSEELNYLRAWRHFRGMSQDELAVAVGTSGAVISLLETGARQLSAKWLRRLAPALKTSPGHLLDHHPDDIPTDMMEIWSSIPGDQRDMALRVLQTFRKTGTD